MFVSFWFVVFGLKEQGQHITNIFNVCQIKIFSIKKPTDFGWRRTIAEWF